MQKHGPWLLCSRFESVLNSIGMPRQSSKSESLQRYKPQLKKESDHPAIPVNPLETLLAA
jgi:hypothetical protein